MIYRSNDKRHRSPDFCLLVALLQHCYSTTRGSCILDFYCRCRMETSTSAINYNPDLTPTGMNFIMSETWDVFKSIICEGALLRTILVVRWMLSHSCLDRINTTDYIVQQPLHYRKPFWMGVSQPQYFNHANFSKVKKDAEAVSIHD